MRLPIPIRLGYHYLRLIGDLNRLDEVFALSDGITEGYPHELQLIVEHVSRTPEGARALREQVRLGRPELDVLANLPAGSLGRTYAEHMRANGLDPAAIPELPAGSPGAFVRAHIYETHDVWHVVTGFGTDVAGELGLLAFYAAQLPGKLQMALLTAGFINTTLFGDEARHERLSEFARGWTLGKRAKPLFGVQWAQLWGVPIDEVRAELGLDESVLERV